MTSSFTGGKKTEQRSDKTWSDVISRDSSDSPDVLVFFPALLNEIKGFFRLIELGHCCQDLL